MENEICCWNCKYKDKFRSDYFCSIKKDIININDFCDIDSYEYDLLLLPNYWDNRRIYANC